MGIWRWACGAVGAAAADAGIIVMERTSESGGGRTGGALSRPDRLEPVPANLSLWRAARPADRAAFRDGPRGATLLHPTHGERRQIGRASCRERVVQYV